MKFSIIVASRDGADKLTETLARLDGLRSEHDHEVILVDNASADDTPRVMERFASTARCAVRVLTESVPGWGRAKNAGAREASGDVLVSIDDDCSPADDYLDQLGVVFQRSEIAYLGGRILLGENGAARIAFRDSNRVMLIPPNSLIPAGLVQGGNMAFRRAQFEALGGFDDRLGAGASFSGADWELSARASAAGMQGGYFPGPVVYHRQPPHSEQWVGLKSAWYDRGRGAVYAKLLLDSHTRLPYARHWWRSRSAAGYRVFARELSGAAHYLMLKLRGRMPLL